MLNFIYISNIRHSKLRGLQIYIPSYIGLHMLYKSITGLQNTHSLSIGYCLRKY